MTTGGSEASLGSGYVLLDEIGAGAMGSVWRARHRATGEIVAVKLLRDGLTGDQDLVLRFVQERNVMRALRHPNIVTVRDFVIEGERLALVMDLVEGGNLRTLLRRYGTLPPAEAVRLMAQVADALAAAHANGVVHRDVKPGNILIEAATGQARLTDFGVARIVHGPGLTQTTSIIGTPTYLAPEVAGGGAPTPAVDVYAFGLILYELLAGRPPFVGHHPIAVLQQHATAAPRRLPGMPDSLWSAISVCTAKDPAERPVIGQVAAALREAAPSLAGLPALPRVSWEDPPSATTEPGVGGYAAAAHPSAGAGTAPGGGSTSGGGEPPAADADAPGGPAPARRERSRRRMVVTGASAMALALSAVAVALVAPWRTDIGPTENRAVAADTLARPAGGEITTAPTPSVPLTTLPTPSGEARPKRTRTVEPPVADPVSSARPRPVRTTAAPKEQEKPKARSTPTRSPVRSTTRPKAEPTGGDSQAPDTIRREPELEWRCRAWFSPAPGVEISPCMAMVGDVFHLLGRVRGSSSVRSDIHIELFDSTRDVAVSPPHVCAGVAPPGDGSIVTCGPVTATAPRTGGNLHNARQRWRKSGESSLKSVESPSVPW